MKYTAEKYQLTFHSPVLTSRGSMAHKNGYLLKANTSNGFTAVGECSYIEGLSIDNLPHYAQKIAEVIATLNASNLTDFLLSTDFLLLQKEFPSIAFGVEMLAANLATQQDFLYFPSPFTQNKLQMPINGLVWMGNKDFMLSQIKDKLKNNFQCIKLKVGALDFDIELELIKYIRSQFDEKTIELRLDANGAFSPTNAAEKLHQLAQYHIHSIEQPIKQNQWAEMATLCQKNIIPIALDEE